MGLSKNSNHVWDPQRGLTSGLTKIPMDSPADSAEVHVDLEKTTHLGNCENWSCCNAGKTCFVNCLNPSTCFFVSYSASFAKSFRKLRCPEFCADLLRSAWWPCRPLGCHEKRRTCPGSDADSFSQQNPWGIESIKSQTNCRKDQDPGK